MGTKLGLQTQMWDTGPDDYAISCKPFGYKIIWDGRNPGTLPIPVLDKFKAAGVPLYICPHFGGMEDQEREFLDNPIAGANRMLDWLAVFQHRWPHWAGYFILNECGFWWHWREKHSQFVEALAPALENYGMRGIFYNFPVGNPPSSPDLPPYEQDPAGFMADLKAQWAPLVPGIRAMIQHGHALGLNQYAPSYPMATASKFHLLRHRLVLEALPEYYRDIKIVLGEVGIDSADPNPWDKRGWRGHCSAGQYGGEIEWLDIELHKDKGVEGGFVFGNFLPYGPGPGLSWSSFDVVGVPEVRDAILAGANIPDEEEPMPEFTLHGRAVPMAAAVGDTSKVLTPPIYMNPDEFYQRTEDWTYLWQRGTDLGTASKNMYTMGADGVLHPKA